MICLISLMFVLSTFLWIVRLQYDVSLFLDLLHGTSNSSNHVQLMGSALVLVNVSTRQSERTEPSNSSLSLQSRMR